MLMRKLSILAATLALSTGTLCAYLHPNYEKGECWGLEAEYLYWLPDIENTLFVLNGTSGVGVQGELVGNDFGFQSGFRVGGAFALDCVSDLQVRYARLRCSADKTVTGTALASVAAIGPSDYVGYATSDLDFFYQNVDLLYSNRVWNSCSFSRFYIVGGLQYYYFSLNEDYAFVETSGTTVLLGRSCHNYGIGPEFGFEFVCPLNFGWCGCDNLDIAIVGQATASLLAHHSHLKFARAASTSAPEDTHANDIWRVVPAWNARAGLQYASTCWCVDYDIEIGYEFNSYVKSLEKLENTTGLATYFAQFYDVGMQGLYVSLGLSF